MQEASRLIRGSTRGVAGHAPCPGTRNASFPGDSDAFNHHSERDPRSSRCNGLQLNSFGAVEPAGSGPPAWAQLGRDAGDPAGTPAPTGTVPGVAPRGATRASAASPGLCLDRGGRSRRKLDRIPPAQAQEGGLRASGRPPSRRYGRRLPGLRHSTRNSHSRGLTPGSGASPPAPSGGRAAQPMGGFLIAGGIIPPALPAIGGEQVSVVRAGVHDPSGNHGRGGHVAFGGNPPLQAGDGGAAAAVCPRCAASPRNMPIACCAGAFCAELNAAGAAMPSASGRSTRR